MVVGVAGEPQPSTTPTIQAIPRTCRTDDAYHGTCRDKSRCVTTRDDREKRALAVLSSLPLGAQLLFHVWEQWAIFGGRYGYVDRLASTGNGLASVVELVLFVGPMGAWVVLLGRALARRAPVPGEARPGDPAIARMLGAVIRVVSPIAAVLVLVHVAVLWGARLVGGEPPLWAYDQLRTTLGHPFWITFYGVMVVAVPWHLAATLPDGLEALGVVGDEGRRQAFVVTLVLGLCLLLLYGQLAGWLATGLGTFWETRVLGAEPVLSQ